MDGPDRESDDASPWRRDDWMPDSAVPDASVFADRLRPPSDPQRASPNAALSGRPSPHDDARDSDSDEASTASTSLGRRIVAAVVVSALVIGAGGALLRNDDDAESTSDADEPMASLDDSLPQTTVPITTRNGTATPATAGDITVAPSAGNDEVLDVPTAIAPVVVGEPPAWAERSVDVPETLALMEPTEVVTLSQDGIVSVSEFPAGRTRSIDVSTLGHDVQLAFGDRTIVVFNSTRLLMIRDGEAVTEVALSDSIIFVRSWTGTGNFIVTAPANGSSSAQQDLVLRPDGQLEPLDDLIVNETAFFSRSFAPTGDALITGPGGVYAVDATGDVRRLSTGYLMATGDRHWAIEECDETLRCAYSIVAWDTGAVTPGKLEPLEQFGFVDPVTRISPDGRSIVYRDNDGSGRRRILDVATGTSVEAGRINQYLYPDVWATDSSGVFVADGFLDFIDRSNGTITQIDGLDRVRSVATGPFSNVD